MRAIVTGSHGFIGTHLCDALEANGALVKCFDTKINHGTSSIGNPWGDSHTIEQADVVFHLACLTQEKAEEEPRLNLDVNIRDTQEIARLCGRYGKRLIFTSSASVYGNQKGALSENAPLLPTSNYGIAKLAAEHFVRKLCSDHMILRLSNVYGPGQTPEDNAYCGFIGKAFHAAINGEPIPIFGDGGQTRDFTYIDDVVDALLYFGTSKRQYEGGLTLNIANGEECSVARLLNTMKYVAADVFPFDGKWPGYDFQSPRSIDNIRQRHLDIGTAVALGWTPETTLLGGLQRTYDWWRERMVKSDSKGDSAQRSAETRAPREA